MLKKTFALFAVTILLFSCSSSYKFLSNNSFVPPDELSGHLLDIYKANANFEAKKMHDWNSAKLYSEKALQAANGLRVKPEKINKWKISKEHFNKFQKAYDNLMQVYDQAIESNPYNLAVAISSLDCWAEQQEENWQYWDINKCKKDYLDAMHNIYNSISKKNSKTNNNLNKSKENSVIVVTKDQNDKIKQIIYFDFDKSDLNNINLNEIKDFLEKESKIIKKFLIVGHTDTKGTKEYNRKLSMERALVVKKALIKFGISKKNIKLLAKGEDELAVITQNETAHPANRRAEISIIN